MVGQTFDEEWNDRGTRFDGGNGRARMPFVPHMCLKIYVRIAHWKNTEDRLLSLKGLGIA